MTGRLRRTRVPDLLGRAEGGRQPLPQSEETPVDDNLTDVIEDLCVANRILSHEGVLDAFGHVSVRHPTDPNRYLLARSRSPLLIEPDDILEYKLDSEPVKRTSVRLYSERVIHGAIYQARSDVMAVCHHHAPSVMPFCISGKPIVPVFHLGATIGEQTPFWDQADEFGDTNLLVVKPEEGQSLARALGRHWVVLMRRHGATVAGTNLKELVSRSIFLCQNAEYQMKAYLLGAPAPLRPGEVKLAGSINVMPSVVARTWEYWSTRLREAGFWPLHVKTPGEAEAKSAAAAGAAPASEKKKRV
jgi:ribulose-5-phosphate 4-epimerase/fuculose-1-phosphate aldolase